MVGDPERDRAPVRRRHRDDLVVEVGVAIGDLADGRREADLHADLALHEDVHERAAVGCSGIRLGRSLGDHLLHEGGGLEVLWDAVDGDRTLVAEGASGAEEPHRALRLSLLGAERHAVAGDAVAERGDLLRGVEQLIPGLWRLGDSGLAEQVGVDEERASGGDQRCAVLHAGHRRRLHEGVLEVGQGVGRDDVLDRVQQVVGGKAGKGSTVHDVGSLIGLDHRGDDVVEVVPRLHLKLDGVVGVSGLEAGDHVLPEALGGVVIARDEEIDLGG